MKNKSKRDGKRLQVKPPSFHFEKDPGNPSSPSTGQKWGRRWGGQGSPQPSLPPHQSSAVLGLPAPQARAAFPPDSARNEDATREGDRARVVCPATVRMLLTAPSPRPTPLSRAPPCSASSSQHLPSGRAGVSPPPCPQAPGLTQLPDQDQVPGHPTTAPPPTARRSGLGGAVWAGRGALPSPTPPRLRGSPPHPRTISTTPADPALPSSEMTMGDWHGRGSRPTRGVPGPARHEARPRAKLPRKASVTDAVSQTTPLFPSGCRHVSRPAPAPAQPPLYAPAPDPCTPTPHSTGPMGKKPASTDQPVLCTHRPRPAPARPAF